ncbi:MAG: nuclear transport factor 2 family protein [Chitinophagaceae bacterium]|nr:nuclear transport factor 2 family protein [Chitinophagaceae bacterium]
MTTQEIANRLVELCRKGDFENALTDLYSNDAVSIEPSASHDFEKETKGLDAIKVKGEKWNSMVEKMNSVTVSDPLIGGNSFVCTMRLDVIMKERGQMDMTELCVYSVKDGKIVAEQFFV